MSRPRTTDDYIACTAYPYFYKMNRIVKFLGSKEELHKKEGLDLGNEKNTKWNNFKSYLKLKNKNGQPPRQNKKLSISSPNLYFAKSNSSSFSESTTGQNLGQIYEKFLVPIPKQDDSVENKENLLRCKDGSKGNNIVMGIKASQQARQQIANGTAKGLTRDGIQSSESNEDNEEFKDFEKGTATEYEKPIAKPRESLRKLQNSHASGIKRVNQDTKRKKPVPRPRMLKQDDKINILK